MSNLLAVLSGIIIAGYAVAGLFFVRFWRRTNDRLFAIFGLAFWLLCIQRILLALAADAAAEDRAFLYLIRLIAFLLIIAGIIDKNRGTGRPSV
jgi:uncharacterized membrane protein YeiB